MESARDLEREWLCFQTLYMDGTTRESPYSQGIRDYYKRKIRPNLTRKFFGVLICGQCLSLLLCATGVANQKLVIACGVKIPGFISFCTYILLAIVFTTKLAWGTEEATNILKERWWKYILIAIVDVYANFLVFTAYEYTSLTSVQLLDCLSIPVVVFLSIAFLKAKYRPVHFCGVFVCVAGLGFMVWADFTSRTSQGPQPGNHHSALLGDFLVIAGACLYAVSNIAEEFVVKTSTITEFLGMMSFFACFFSGANVILFERGNLSHVIWDPETILYLALSVISMFLFYFLMPLLIYHSSATMVNLMLLTADLYSLFAGLYLFDYKFSNLYIWSFVIILLGVVIFKVFPTPSRVDAPTSEGEGTSISSDSEGDEDSSTEHLIQ
ncbi:solute carrier family 35 member F2-like [Dendronephthya gigantea]|uniref:solute carrier family 35 member F2-like n=1 Tax=Dendronephthya gigantea TaxID=151771 RepID=UPI00106AB3EF|nr:solute carrier family 35 member F2-like [Dendronephthya gigantea]